MEQLISIQNEAMTDAKSKLIDFSNKIKNISYNNHDLMNEIILALESNHIIITDRMRETDETLLMLLAKRDLKDITNILIRKILNLGTNEILELKDHLGNTALMHAAIFNNCLFFQAVHHALTFTHINLKNNNNKTVLMFSAEYNNKEFIEEIFKKKINPSIEDKEQSLLLAVKGGHNAVVELLLSKGINTNVKNSDGHTLLEVAIQNNHYDTADILIKKYPIRRITLTIECISMSLQELIKFNPEVLFKYPIMVFGWGTDKLAGLFHWTAESNIFSNFLWSKTHWYNTLLSNTLSSGANFFRKIYESFPHWFENVLVRDERKNRAMQSLYVASSNYSRTPVVDSTVHPVPREREPITHPQLSQEVTVFYSEGSSAPALSSLESSQNQQPTVSNPLVNRQF